MSRIYINQKSSVSLWHNDYDDKTPYVIKLGNNIIARVDFLGDAYRLYNKIVVKYSN